MKPHWMAIFILLATSLFAEDGLLHTTGTLHYDQTSKELTFIYQENQERVRYTVVPISNNQEIKLQKLAGQSLLIKGKLVWVHPHSPDLPTLRQLQLSEIQSNPFTNLSHQSINPLELTSQLLDHNTSSRTPSEGGTRIGDGQANALIGLGAGLLGYKMLEKKRIKRTWKRLKKKF